MSIYLFHDLFETEEPNIVYSVNICQTNIWIIVGFKRKQELLQLIDAVSSYKEQEDAVRRESYHIQL